MQRLLVPLLLALLLAHVSAALGTLDPEAEKAARGYLTALARNDRPTMKRLSPSQPADFYGPFMFAQLPSLENPRVDSHRAAVDFEGKSIDPDLPSQGIITLVKLDDRTTDAWVVRQVLWYDEKRLPVGVQVPKKSVTSADQRQEPQVFRSARSFLLAWQNGDYQQMEYLHYDWLSRERKPPKSVKLRSLSLREAGRLEGAIKVTFEARLTLLGFIPYRAKGLVYVLKEGDAWKVRGNNVSF